MPSIEFPASGHNEFIAVTGAKTLADTDSGIVQNVTANAVLTLPAAAAGKVHKVRVGKEGLTISVIPAGADTLSGNGFTPAANKGVVFTNQPAGSLVELVSGAATWYISKLLGTATRTP